MADCTQSHSDKYSITVEIDALNDGSHVSQENFWILETNCIALLIFLFFIGFSITKYIQIVKKEEYSENPLVLVIFGLLLELSNITLETFNQIAYI